MSIEILLKYLIRFNRFSSYILVVTHHILFTSLHLSETTRKLKNTKLTVAKESAAQNGFPLVSSTAM